MSLAQTTTNARYCRMLADLLTATPLGELVTYQQMSALLGFDVKRRRWLTIRARDIANGEAGAVYVSERNVGYRRLPNREGHALGAVARTRQRKIARRSAKHMTNAMLYANDATDDDRREFHTEIAAQRLLEHFTLRRNLPRVAASEPIPTADGVRRSVDAVIAQRAARDAQQPRP